MLWIIAWILTQISSKNDQTTIHTSNFSWQEVNIEQNKKKKPQWPPYGTKDIAHNNRSQYLLAYANELTQEGLMARSEALNSVLANMAG